MEPTIPIDSQDKKTEKTKKKLSKKAKIIIALISAIVVISAIAAILIFVVFKKEEPVIELTDRDILSSISWEKEGSPTVIWTFDTDGTGEITTNKSNYYGIKWTLEEGDTTTLNITTDWLYDLNDSFTFTLNRETTTFHVVNLVDGTESTFVQLGTAEKAAAEKSDQPEATELEKTE